MNAGRTRNPAFEHMSCRRCNGTFKRIEHLRRHERIHETHKRFACSQCSKDFTRSDILRRHEATHTAVAETNDTCPERKRACIECARARERCTKSDPCQRCSMRGLRCSYPQGRANGRDRQTLDQSQVLHSSSASLPRTSPLDAESTGDSALSTVSGHPPRLIADIAPRDAQSAYPTYNSSNEQMAPFEMMDLGGNEYDGIQNFQPNMDFPLNWLPTDNSLAIDYDNILGLGINSFGLFPSLAESVPNMPAVAQNLSGENGSLTIGNAQTRNLTQRDTDPRATNHQSLSWNAASPEIAEGHVSSPSSSSAICTVSPGHAPGGLYATSSNGARMPCTIRARRPNCLIPGATPINPVNDAEFHLRDCSDQLEFPDTSHISVEYAFPPVNNRMSSTPVLATTTYESIRQQFHKLCLSENGLFPIFTATSFPSPSALNMFVKLYYENLDLIVPILHDQVTKVNDHWLLAVATCAVGCQYAEAEEFSACVIPLHEFLRRAITVETASEDLQSVGKDEHGLAMAQAMTLSQIGMLYCGSSRLHKLARARHSALIELTRSHTFLSSSSLFRIAIDDWTNDANAQEMVWKQALVDECKRRIGYTIWLLDCMAVYHFSQRSTMPLDVTEYPLPNERLWETKSAAEWAAQRGAASETPSLSTAVGLLFREKQAMPDLGQFSRVLLLHGVYQQIFQLRDCFARPLGTWVPSMQQVQDERNSPESSHMEDNGGQPLLSSWRNAALDCVDVLHWAANATIALQAGAEHPTVLHLHLARTVLLVPFDQIQTLASSLISIVRDASLIDLHAPTGQQARDAERDVLEWAQRDQYKARLAVLHCGCLFWHIRRYSCRAFYEPIAVFLATLTIWAYSSYASRAGLPNHRTHLGQDNDSQEGLPASLHQSSNGVPPISDIEPVPTFIRLDRPNDDEMVQLFVRSGAPSVMTAHITGVGDICSPKGPVKILREGRKILAAASMAWGRTHKYTSILHALEQVASGQVNVNVGETDG